MKCGVTKPAAQFATAPTKKNGRQSWCRLCSKIYAASHEPTDGTAICTVCEIEKPSSHFERASRKVNGIRSECKECRGKKRRARHAELRADPVTSAKFAEDKRRRMLSEKYGMTPDEFARMLATQGKCCKICKAVEPGGRVGVWHVDHDHLTGKVRGILCHSCNVGLGHFRDSVELLSKAIDYLSRGHDTRNTQPF